MKLNHHQLCENGPFGSTVRNKIIVSFSSFIIGGILLTQEDKDQYNKATRIVGFFLFFFLA